MRSARLLGVLVATCAGIACGSQPDVGTGPEGNPGGAGGGGDTRDGNGPVVHVNPGDIVPVPDDTCTKPPAGIVVEGDYVVPDDKDIEICARYIMVHKDGHFRVGSEGQPFKHKATITLFGSDPNETVMEMGTKFVGAMQGGVIDIHGSPPETPWTKLAAPVAAGATSFEVLEAKGWRIGDEIVLASGNVEGREAETFKITAIEGAKITVDHALVHARPGLVRTVAGRPIDTRTEVANLTRNVVVRGDESSTESHFGGHMMIMAGGKGFIDGVELRRMGQFDHLGRYPIHWHIAGDVTGQYLKRSTVNRSLQRGVVIHSTQHVLVQDNVVFDSVGHGFIVETPDTVDNTWDHNLSLVNHLANFTQATLKTQNDAEPANFWIRAAKNTFTRNSAAGSVGSGFWFDATTDTGVTFRDNVAHSSIGNATDEPDQKLKIDFNRESGIFAQTDTAVDDSVDKGPANVFERTVLFQNRTDLWPADGAQTYVDTVFADSAGFATTGEGCYAVFENAFFAGVAPSRSAPLPPVHTQYNGKMIFNNPTFVGYGQILSANDINQPWMSDFVIKNAKLIDCAAGATTPDDQSVLETLDDTFLPKGFYAPKGSGLQSSSAVVAMTADIAIFRAPQRLGYASLVVSVNDKTIASNATVARSDGATYGIEPSARGFRVITTGGLSYRLSGVPAGAFALSLDPFQNYNQTTAPPGIDASSIEVALPLAAVPTAVTRAPQDGGPLTAAGSLSAFRAAPNGTYFYDQAAKLLYLQASFASVTVRP